MPGNKGFSLLEVMVALAVLSIGLLGLASLVSTSHRVLGIGNQNTLATQLAKNKMEALRAVRPVPGETTEEVLDTGMTRRWSIAQSTTDNPRLWVITVEVYPNDDPEQSVLLKSLLLY